MADAVAQHGRSRLDRRTSVELGEVRVTDRVLPESSLLVAKLHA
ncbi:MAG: hypothetical protein ACI89X_001182 [Planctomycetota bacterium]|jgi:hypothetical protein